VDGVALASVITSGVAVIATSGIAVWSARQSAKLARETRVQQRLGESYLEVLRIVEREGQWVENASRVWLWPLMGGSGPEPRVTVPTPAVTDRATAAAHLAAFGSPNVRGLYRAWRSTITAIGTDGDAVIGHCIAQDPEGLRLSPGSMLNGLHARELAARQALADAIAKELGHG
jgi:hypothetical protein